jgi:hypothetical protein
MPECGKGCVHYPPSSSKGKPCGYCDPSVPEMNCYQQKSRGRPKKPDALRQEYRVRLNNEQRAQLKTLASKNGMTEAAMLRKLVKEAFERS